jgi:hypothetical protein
LRAETYRYGRYKNEISEHGHIIEKDYVHYKIRNVTRSQKRNAKNTGKYF